ncbi:MAG: hypothetical protein ACE5NM_13705, partial [Sedimentisphaerales bacterium]
MPVENRKSKIENAGLFSRIILGTMFLILLATQPGCKPRPLVRPTPQMDIEPRFWVRVLLLDDVTGCTLRACSPFSVTGTESDSQTLARPARFTPVGATKVEISGGKITIAGRPFT